MPDIESIASMKLTAGAACLEFVNSGYDKEPHIIRERLNTYDDLLKLARRTNIISDEQLSGLKTAFENDQDQASLILKKAIKARTILYQVFLAISANEVSKLRDSVVDEFNKLMSEHILQPRFVIRDNRLSFISQLPDNDLSLPTSAFIESASHLIGSTDQQLIKQCCGCAWFFLDKTKNHTRKWCNMEDCGSRAKSKRYYQQKKKAR